MNRNENREKAKKVIDDIFARIDQLERNKDKVSEESKESYQEIMNKLNARKNDLLKRFEDVQNASDDKLEEASKIFSDSAESFKEGFSKLSSLFKNK